MLNGGGLDLNFAESSSDSSKERLKQTMLNQELVFMRQVYELHRLHRLQLGMMEDFQRKGGDSYNLHNGGLKPISVTQNNKAKCSMVDVMQSESFKPLHEQHRLPGFMQKPVDLQLSADEFINCCANDSGKEVLRDFLKESLEPKNSFQGVVAFGPDDLNLDLSLGQDARKKVEVHRPWMENKTCASSSNVIDLEDPYIGFPNNNAYLGLGSGCPIQSLCSRGKHKLESFSQSGMKDVSYSTPTSRSLVTNGPSCQKQTPSDSGFNGNHREMIPADQLSKDQGTCKANNLDLNVVQLEDSSYFSGNHSIVHNLSRTSFSAVSDKDYPKCTIGTSITPAWRQASVDIDLNVDLAVSYRDINRVELNKDDKFREGDAGKISFIDLESDSGEDPERIESVGSSSEKVPDGVLHDIGLVDKVEAEANITIDCNKPCSSSESDCIIDQQSSSLKTMQSGVKCGEFSFSNSDESQKANTGNPADQSGEQEQKSSDSSTESNIQSIDKKEPEVDEIVQTAAELLVQLSSETQVCEMEKDDQPQRSTDSYEALVLNAKECGPDDYCISSNAFVVDDDYDDSEKKGSRYKLKRGTRRMKDFQKDVLPSLSVLSRQEIREDINILEGVIRSREYKRMRGKMGDDGDDWCRPARSKRSRIGGSRRYYQ